MRRVFISEEFEELLPKYLSFVRGIVDSDSLPLNVSREMLQQHSSLKTIKKKLVRKVLDMIKKLADESEEDVFEDDEDEEYEDEEGGEEEEEEEDDEDVVDKYKDFWKNYGKSIKMGVIEDSSNRTRLAKLLRFYTSKSEDELVSLEEYVERMSEDQKGIFFIVGSSMEEIKRSPLLETLLEEDIEVIFFVDPLDEYVMQNLTEFDDHKFQNVAKDELKLKDKTEDEKELEKRTKDYFKPLLKWWKEILEADGVSQVSTRLPCMLYKLIHFSGKQISQKKY